MMFRRASWSMVGKVKGSPKKKEKFSVLDSGGRARPTKNNMYGISALEYLSVA